MNGGADGTEDRWEERVRSLAQDFTYPPTPDVAGKVRAQLLREGRGRATGRRPRQRLALAGLLVALLLAGLLAVPQVRAAVVRALRIGAIRILEGEAMPLPGTPLLPTAEIPIPELAGETTLAEAQRQAGFAVRLPAYPPDLGTPHRVYFQEMGGAVVVLVWMDRERPEQVRLALHQLGPGSFADKVQPPVVEEAEVGGNPAAWTEGPYLLEMHGGTVDVTRLVTGHVLVWAEGEVTYRLESDLDLEEAVRIAESLQ